MAQQIVSWFVSDGRFRVQAINAVGRKMQRLVDTLRVSSGEFGHDGVWTPDTNP